MLQRLVDQMWWSRQSLAGLERAFTASHNTRATSPCAKAFGWFPYDPARELTARRKGDGAHSCSLPSAMAAIDAQVSAGHEATGIAQQEDGGAPVFLWRTQPA